MIQAERLTKRYGDTVAVDGVTFTVHPGRVTGFLGPNGAGKSTTRRMILGLDAPTAGSVRVNGRPYAELAAPLRAVGALLEPKALEGGRTAAGHLLWLAHSNRIGRGRVDEVLDIVGLTEVAGHRAGTFSLGMNQRLGIAAALLGDPETLIFDEPINGLDPDGILWIRNLLRSLAADGRTVFLSSHLMGEMAQTADHLVVIARGRIVADSPAAQILERGGGARVRVRAIESGQAELARRLTDAGARVETTPDGSLSVAAADTALVGDVAAAAGIALRELAREATSLEQAFLDLTHHDTEYRAGGSAPAEESE